MELNLRSLRARQAREAAKIGEFGSLGLLVLSIVLGVTAFIVLIVHGPTRPAYAGLSISLAAGMVGLWYRRFLTKLPPNSPPRFIDDLVEVKLLAHFPKNQPITPRIAWQASTSVWQGKFMLSHLFITADEIQQTLASDASEMAAVWQESLNLMQQQSITEMHGGILTTALILSSQRTKAHMALLNLTDEDILRVYSWLERLSKALKEPRPYFGGIGRDWASGFTPMLDQFGQNISASVESGNGHFHTLAHGDVLDSIVHSLGQPQGSVALVGPAGAGKTSLVYALAERLLSGMDKELEFYHIISLNASAILSAAADKLEKIMLTLFSEAAHARNVIIFLDEAELFFGKGTGAFDVGKILLPLLQNQSIKLIATFTPEDWEQLKAGQSSLVAHVTPIIINEPNQALTMQILEDSALTFEVQNHIVITYQAVREAFRLSTQYMQDQAYPGKSINLLQQSIPYVQQKIMTAESVQAAVEKTRGVKVSKAEAPEANTLLNLEEQIHTRMINQQRAVQVVSAALRRGRTGVADPKRPLGSFLFLGPTGVGKTELARSLADVYFGDEHQMIRLDMTEYQQPSDVERLLEVGGSTDRNLILRIREQPFSVVLFDEIEKSNPAVLNLFLQLLDEGQLTDKAGRPASFRSSIVIATSNAGSAEIAKRVASGDSLQTFERPLIDELISGGQFRAELINRFDEIVLFRPLNQTELLQVAKLMLKTVNNNLAKQNVTVQLTDAALNHLVQKGFDPEFGARPMRRVIQETVEDAVATRILKGEAQPGSTINLDIMDLTP